MSVICSPRSGGRYGSTGTGVEGGSKQCGVKGGGAPRWTWQAERYRRHRVDLHLGRGRGHHDHGAGFEVLGTQCHALGMVAGGRANHTTLELLGAQMRHLVICAAQLETEHRLLVFTFEQNGVVQSATQGLGGFQVGLHRDIVDTGCQDFRVRAAIVDPTEVLDGTTQRPPHS